MGVPRSSQIAQETEPKHAPQMSTPAAIGAWPGGPYLDVALTRRPGGREHAGDITRIGDAFDGRHQKPGNNPWAPLNESSRIVDKGDRDFRSERLHFAVLRVNLNNVQIGIRKMNNVQEESLRDQKKGKRRLLLLEIARGIIASKGLRELKVRDVAEAADCSIGSVYNEFGDFDGLILTVNRETVEALTVRLAAVPTADPIAQLHGLAASYLEFASANSNLLRSLFEHRMENDRPFPEDILVMVMQAFALMHDPLVRLMPDRDPKEIALQARMMFSAVHGIISLGLEERMVAVPPENLRQHLAQFVDTYLAGLGFVSDATRRKPHSR
jgi:AcrR family transcriptional regulator